MTLQSEIECKLNTCKIFCLYLLYVLVWDYGYMNDTTSVFKPTAEAGQTALEQKEQSNVAGGIERKSTRTWAMETGYDAKKIFNKVC